MASAAERQSKYRANLESRGLATVTCCVTRDTDALLRSMAKRRKQTLGQVIDFIIGAGWEALASQTEPKPQQPAKRPALIITRPTAEPVSAPPRPLQPAVDSDAPPTLTEPQERPSSSLQSYELDDTDARIRACASAQET